jgi:hypothetical protein
VSYYESVSGIGRRGYSEGMGAAFPVGTVNEPLRAVQQSLQRMQLLAPGAGPSGADGRWGSRTAAALTQAARQLGRHSGSPPFSVTNGGRTINIPDDFIAAIQAAGAPAATTPLPPPPDASTATPTTEAQPLPLSVEETHAPSNMRLYLIGGTVAAVALGAAVYLLRSAPAAPRRVTANRRRR